MNFSFRELHIHITISIAPDTLCGVEIPEILPKFWKVNVFNQLTELRLQLADYLPGTAKHSDKKAALSSVQQYLVRLSNSINSYLLREYRKWSLHKESSSIRLHYLYVLSEIENLLAEIHLLYPAYYDANVKYSDFKVSRIKPSLRNRIITLQTFLLNKMPGSKLTDIVICELNKLLRPFDLNKTIDEYINELAIAIETRPVIDDSVLLQILIEFNFNTKPLVSYKIDIVEFELTEVYGLHDQIEKLIWLSKPNTPSASNFTGALYPDRPSISEQLSSFYLEKVAHLEKLVAAKRIALNDRDEMTEIFRMSTELSVPQLALFIRLLREKGVIVKKETGEVFSFFARHIYTDNALFISSKNMLKKSTEVEYATALKLWTLLEDMLTWLDESFSIRDYKRS